MLEKIFGRHSTVRIIDAILKKENRNRWMNLREIARQAELNPGTISRNIDELVTNKILLEEKPSKMLRIFKLNSDNKTIIDLIGFYDKLSKTK